MALAQRTGLDSLVARHLRLGRGYGVNAQVKMPCLVAGMVAGADSIDDMALLREGCPYCSRGPGAVHAGIIPALVHLEKRAKVNARVAACHIDGTARLLETSRLHNIPVVAIGRSAQPYIYTSSRSG
jgi:hypothetical protein